MNRTALATLVGLILGLALVFGNFGDMLIVGLLGAIGYGIAKALDGDLDVSAAVTRHRARLTATSAAHDSAATQALTEPVTTAAQSRLDELQLTDPPRLSVRVIAGGR